MKVMYNIKSSRGKYDVDKFFTYGKEYNVIADYRKRQSGQIQNSGFVVVDNMGQSNMLFPYQVKITDDNKEGVYIFEYIK